MEYGVAFLIGLRDYRRSRSETITRAAAVFWIARARTEADRDALVEAFEMRSQPLAPELTYDGVR